MPGYHMERRTGQAIRVSGAAGAGRAAHWLESCFYAWGKGGLPAEIPYEGGQYVRVATFKHDFLAGTGLYEAADAGTERPRRLVCKTNRTMHFCFVPLRWLGRLTTGRGGRQPRGGE